MELIDKDALVAGIKKLHGNPFYRMAIKDVLSILDTMQEEPLCDDLEEAAEAWCHNDDNTGSCDYIGVTVCEYAFKAGAKWQKQKDSIVSEELIDVAKQYVKEHVIGIDKITFRIATDMFISGANWQKKRDYIPLSDDINEVARQFCKKVLNCEIDYKEGDVVLSDEEECVKAGIRWQKKQDQSTIELAEDHAMLAGMEKMKEQMMEKAIDGKIYETQARSKLKAVTTGYLSRIDYEVGDKIKVIIIKED